MGGLTFGVLLPGGQKRERDGEAAGLRQPIAALCGTQFVHQCSDTAVQTGTVSWLPSVLTGKTKPMCKVHQQVLTGSDIAASQLSNLPGLHT